MACAGMIEDYLDALDRRLHGPGSVKSELLTEVRHSLEDAAEAYRDDGLTTAGAEQRAVREFGGVDAVAEDCQAELAVSHSLGTVRTLLAGVVLLVLMWEVGRRLIIGPWEAFPGPPLNPLAGLAFGMAERLGIVLGLVIAVLLLSVRLLGRRTSARALSSLLTRFNVLAVLVYGTTLFLVCALGMFLRPEVFQDVGMVVIMTVTVLVMSRLGWLAGRSLRL
ncbi:permease prefix domain 1-containing protein [Actinoalloteichus hoggarensis]|uniref:Uncharacterized protein n=2 Tax=Actinoalloteichus hoggarensis TaxID=1470176 RepID=A0A221VYD1_9PSEU|nr:permease prefix domain 1-containing protein [Actinoalloteichus hoggarensis]ASO18525.1 hypothetical protein AHOG_04345 [Actinoalloteichus hoggarensis]